MSKGIPAVFKYAEGVGFGSRLGEMAEWFKAAVLKTVVGLHPTGGSNPSLSALLIQVL